MDFQPAAEATGGDGVDECWITQYPVAAGRAEGHALTGEGGRAGARWLLALARPRNRAGFRGKPGRALSSTLGQRRLATRYGGPVFPTPIAGDGAALYAGCPMDTSCCWGTSKCAISDGQALVDPASWLGVLKLRRGDGLRRWLPPTTWMKRAKATMPQLCPLRRQPRTSSMYAESGGERGGVTATEHRFDGLFTMAAMNANVLENPALISRRVEEALGHGAHGIPAIPMQLLLHDIIQTIPPLPPSAVRAELRATVLDMARQHGLDAGSQSPHPRCSCARINSRTSCPGQYLPRGPLHYRRCGSWKCRTFLESKLGGRLRHRLFCARVSESSWAVVHSHCPKTRRHRPRQSAVDGPLARKENSGSRTPCLTTRPPCNPGDRTTSAKAAARRAFSAPLPRRHYASAFPGRP